MVDRLTALLSRFELRAQVLHGGLLGGPASEVHRGTTGHLHLLGRGALELIDAQGRRSVLDQPGVLFVPRPLAYRLEAGDGSERVCASIAFGLGDENPLLRALPDVLAVPLARLPGLAGTHQLLFDEATRPRCGHAAVVDRLTEVLLIQLLRYAIEQRLVDGGLMAGLSDPRLHRALAALHGDPARPWTLETLAGEAGMSRARFAAHFARQVGMPPGEYLVAWRLGLARTLLRRGLPVKQVALEVGYANASALARVFTQRLGCNPTAWQRGHATMPPALRTPSSASRPRPTPTAAG